MKATIKQRNQNTELLEQRTDDLEQCYPVDVLITGLDTKYHSYAWLQPVTGKMMTLHLRNCTH